MPPPRRFALLFLVVAACGDDFTPTLEHPWRPGSPGDVACVSACQQVAEVDDAHLGKLEVLVDPTATDGAAQFEECARSILACWIGDAELAACVASSACPAPCRAEYARLVGGAGDLAAQAAGLEAVFLDPGAPCAQPAAEVTP